jgi:bifunctional non-homologous end joining protein LigD
MHIQAPTASLLTRVPVQFYVFDLLQVDDQSVLTAPFLERREQLAELGLDVAGLVRTPPHYTDIAGADLLAVAQEQQLEGAIAKRATSRCYPGKRTQAEPEPAGSSPLPSSCTKPVCIERT